MTKIEEMLDTVNGRKMLARAMVQPIRGRQGLEKPLQPCHTCGKFKECLHGAEMPKSWLEDGCWHPDGCLLIENEGEV